MRDSSVGTDPSPLGRIHGEYVAMDANMSQIRTRYSPELERFMNDQKNTLARLFAACWKDEALKARFMSDPKAVLKEHGLDVPDGIDVKVVENADDCVHITLPAPPAGHMELQDDELSNAAGGVDGKSKMCPHSGAGGVDVPCV